MISKLFPKNTLAVQISLPFLFKERNNNKQGSGFSHIIYALVNLFNKSTNLSVI